MPWRLNPFTGTMQYYSLDLPECAGGGEVLALNTEADGWEWVNPADTIGSVIVSKPETSHLRVTNLYVDSNTGKLAVEYDDEASTDALEVISNPPQGHYRVTNIYVDSSTNRAIVGYEDTPQS